MGEKMVEKSNILENKDLYHLVRCLNPVAKINGGDDQYNRLQHYVQQYMYNATIGRHNQNYNHILHHIA